jgi:predicted RNase H-like nuclease (RuvC/YqgF family)
MQVELLDRINRLEDTILQLREKISNSDAIQERIIKEKDADIQKKNDEIHDLNTKMDDMAEEFSQMLKVSSRYQFIALQYCYYYDYYYYYYYYYCYNCIIIN